MKLVEIAFDTPLSSSGCLLYKEKALFLCLLAALESFAPSITRKVSPFGSRKPGDATNPKSQFSGRESQFKAAQLLSSVVNWVPSIWTYYSFPQPSHVYAQ